MGAEFFLDNWTYLKVEFNWLERLLLNAVARQRKDLKAIEQASQRTADRVTSHWWKGLVSFEETIASDSPVEQRKPISGMSYQQQLEARIQMSGRRGIGLALPMLCDRLNLTTAEKNVILIALAPEVQRRYAQLYGYLQSGREVAERPTVDLVLRLLCRTDAEWRSVRSFLIDSSRLVRSGVITVGHDQPFSLLLRALHLNDQKFSSLHRTVEPNDETLSLFLRELHLNDEEFLSSDKTFRPKHKKFSSSDRTFYSKDESFSFLGRSLYLKDEFVEFLLKDPVELDELEELISPAASFEPALVRSIARSPVDLIAPKRVHEQLEQVYDQVRFAPQLQAWGFSESIGTTALLIGASGTGKTIAVQSIAQKLEMPLTEIDLSIVDDAFELIEDLIAQSPPILLIKSAEHWLKRSAPISQVIELIESRCGLTCFSVRHRLAIPTLLRSRIQFTIELPKPDVKARTQLWKQAFPATAPIAEFDWNTLAKKYVLTGGEIRKIAEISAIEALSHDATKIELFHILKAVSRLCR